MPKSGETVQDTNIGARIMACCGVIGPGWITFVIAGGLVIPNAACHILASRVQGVGPGDQVIRVPGSRLSETCTSVLWNGRRDGGGSRAFWGH